MSIKGLQRILRKRLAHIDRWKYVKVTKDNGTFTIRWYGPKGKNFHPYEYKEIPYEDLEIVTERNRMRLRNETKAYK